MENANRAKRLRDIAVFYFQCAHGMHNTFGKNDHMAAEWSHLRMMFFCILGSRLFCKKKKIHYEKAQYEIRDPRNCTT